MTKFSLSNTRASKLKPEDVVRIRDLYHNKGYTQRALGIMYHIATETVGRIVRGDTWKAYGGAGITAQSEAQEEHEAGLEAGAFAAQADSPEIQASLAKLGRLLERDKELGHGKSDVDQTDGGSFLDREGSEGGGNGDEGHGGEVEGDGAAGGGSGQGGDSQEED